jgi:hypothetical protein
MAELESERQETFANREDAIPVISIDHAAGSERRSATPTFAGREGGSQSARDRLRALNAQATAKLKEKLDSLQESKKPEPSSMQERMLNL